MTTPHPIPDAALAHHIAVVGKTGSGKTFAAKGMVERLLGSGARTVIIDPTGVWWGLRLARGGKRASPFDIAILGGRHADLPLGKDGEALARILGGSATSAILDVQLLGVGERTRLFAGFAEALLRENRGPLHLVIDEAHLFAPQGGGAGGFEQAQMLHATNNLVALGRSAGLRITLISQRPAKLHKDALTQVETMVAMRVISPQDRKAVADWLAGAPEGARAGDIMATLASLKVGEGWVYAPEQGVLERAAFPAITTFDSGRPIEAGEMPALKPLDVAALREAMAAAAPAPVASEGKFAPARRQSEASATSSRPANDAELAAAEQRGYEHGLVDGEARGLERGAKAGWRAAATCLQRDLDGFCEAIGSPADHEAGEAEVAKALGLAAWPGGKATEATAKPAAKYYSPPRTAPPPTPVAKPNGHAGGIVSLPPAKRKILDALAWLESIGQVSPPRNVVAFVGGISSKSSAYENNVSALRTAGLLDYPGSGLLALTQDGRALAAPPTRKLTHEVMMEAIADKLAPAHMRLLRAAAEAHPRALSRGELAERAQASIRSSAFENNVSRLSSLGLVTYPARGEVRAADLLFPGNR